MGIIIGFAIVPYEGQSRTWAYLASRAGHYITDEELLELIALAQGEAAEALMKEFKKRKDSCLFAYNMSVIKIEASRRRYLALKREYKREARQKGRDPDLVWQSPTLRELKSQIPRLPDLPRIINHNSFSDYFKKEKKWLCNSGVKSEYNQNLAFIRKNFNLMLKLTNTKKKEERWEDEDLIRYKSFKG